MTKKFFQWAVVGVLASASWSNHASSASESALSTITVIESIDLIKNTDLNFPQAAQGDAPETVAPADTEAATFTVTGAPNSSFSTTVNESSIEMIVNLGSTAEEVILVESFQHNAPAQLDALGSASFGVGATRAGILANQVPGNYQGTFNVTVSYQ